MDIDPKYCMEHAVTNRYPLHRPNTRRTRFRGGECVGLAPRTQPRGCAKTSTILKGDQTMNKTIAALLLLAALTGTTHAQVRKCILPDGKVTYSDVLCNKDVAKQADVNLVANSVDKSPARAEARKFAMERLIALARQREPNRCKFTVEPSIQGDGQQLAEAATQECFANIVAEQTGHPIRNDAFERWFENQQLAEGKRSARSKPGTEQAS
jgi:hypothetical protein